jgi:hypothetical protein
VGKLVAQPSTKNYFFVESFLVVVEVDILLLVVSPLILFIDVSVVAGADMFVFVLSVFIIVVELSLVVELSPELLQAVKTAAIAKIPRNFFMCCLILNSRKETITF